MNKVKYIAEWASQSGFQRGGFGASLLNYICKRFWELPIDWWWVGVGVASIALVASLTGGYYTSPTLGGQISKTMILRVAQRGDYELAERLLAQYQTRGSKGQILGVESTLEETVNPERKVEREIERVVKLVENYPTSRDLLLYTSRLFSLLGNEEKASEYFEKARVLDPNGVI